MRMWKRVLLTLAIVGLLLLLSACSSTTAPVVREQYYIHMVRRIDSLAVPSTLQNHILLDAQTNVIVDSGVVHWTSDKFWLRNSVVAGQIDTVPTVNGSSYPYNGDIHTVFAAINQLAGQTATVIASIEMNGKLVADTMYVRMY